MASHYNILDYNPSEYKKTLPISNLASAAFFIANILSRAGIPYGLFGGFAVQLMGGNRETRNVDIAFEAPGGIHQLWRVLEVETRYDLFGSWMIATNILCRLIIPNTKYFRNTVKVFVRTGPGFDKCQSALLIEVNLIQNGTTWLILSRDEAYWKM